MAPLLQFPGRLGSYPIQRNQSCDVRSKHKVDLLAATLADNQHGVVACRSSPIWA